MRLLSVGVDYRTAPTVLREALAFEGTRQAAGLARLRERFPGIEFVILSTCNRVELYAANGGDEPLLPAVGDLAGWLAGFHGVKPELLAGHLVAHHDEAVVGHLFRVASSLESLVLGEGQILGQVRDAYKAADAEGTVGSVLHELFQQAIRVGKRVREETGMDRGKLSVASVAVDVARDVFDAFRDKTVLVIGAGKMADLTLQHLVTLHPGRILVTNRSAERATAAAARFGGEIMPFEHLGKALIAADMVVSTTASEEPIVSFEMYAAVQRARRNRLALILDIAVPRDFDERVGTLEQVLLYNVDDLRAQVDRNLASRRQQVDPAQAIIEQETAACLAALDHRQRAGVLLQQLGQYAENLSERELQRLFSLCPDLSDGQRTAIRQFARKLQNQFLHHPRTALRDATRGTVAPAPQAGLLEAVRHLFGLDHAEHPR
jgi:glutamyl-tRNA reductase